MAIKNECLKERKVDNPYEIWQNAFMPGWEWRVLKKWQANDSKPFARYFCAVKSPMTYGEWEYGDTYVSDIKIGGAFKLSQIDMNALLKAEKETSRNKK